MKDITMTDPETVNRVQDFLELAFIKLNFKSCQL